MPLPYPTLTNFHFSPLPCICPGCDLAGRFQRHERLMLNRVEWCLIALNLLRNSCANFAQHLRLRSWPQAVLREDV